MLQVFALVRKAGGDLVVGEQDVLLQLQGFHLVHDEVRVVQGFGQIAEGLQHLLLGLEVEFVVVEGEAFALLAHLVIAVIGFGRALLFAGVDAQQDVVRVAVRLIHIVAVVAGDHRYVVLLRPLQQHGVHAVLFRHPVALDLHVVVLAEQVEPPLEFLLRLGQIGAAAQNGLWYACAQAARCGDQAFVVLLDQLLIDACILAVEAFHVPERAQLAQVPVARRVLRQHQLVEALVLVLAGEGLLVPVRYHVELAAHDRLHLRRAVLVLVLARLGHELEHAEHVAMVRDGERGLPIGSGFLVQRGDAGRAIEK